MSLSKRERVFRTVELDGEPDLVPIFTLGFERTAKSFLAYQDSEEKKECATWVKATNSRLSIFSL